jgi:SAM-dependent methyltransferase
MMRAWLRRVAITLSVMAIASPTYADLTIVRNQIPPFCNNAYELILPGMAREIQVLDAQFRDLFIMQALGHQGILAIDGAIKRPSMGKIQTLEEALHLADLLMDDPGTYGPVLQQLAKLTPSQRWALYLNSGFHAVPTHSDGHREMNLEVIDHFPKNAPGEDPARVADIGLGAANLIVAAAVRNPFGITYGIEIAGTGLNVGTQRLNLISDAASARFNDPGHAQTGRFWVARGSATDPHLYKGQKFDAASMVLTLFAIPPAQRAKALKNIYDSLEPGAKFVLVDPLPVFSDKKVARRFLQDIITSAYKNNTDLTALDISVLVANNAHNLFKTEFLTAEEQKAMGESVGFKAIGDGRSVYYGIANMQVFEKPLQ